MMSFIPPWQDKATLCACICASETTIDNWVRMGLLPAPRKRGGKLMWKWAEVDRYLENGGSSEQSSPDALAEKIRHATRAASN